ncbi:ZIP family metal transporter [Aliiroseovarius sp. YM-037]|uniref:ZIP family metal transporter n=1 Tax=Aliiroseovarius sp. YM-037 TaxID=3341728 RepID=UPI003A80B0DA
MSDIALALLLATLAGVTIPIGAVLASVERINPRWLEEEFRHTVIAFGGGALFSAIALVLIPEGTERLTSFWSLFLFAAGGVSFFAVDSWLSARGGHGAQFMAMMLDYVPEAAALGALLAYDPNTAYLLAGIIAIQNLPEGFNAYREIDASNAIPRGRLLLLFVLVVPAGPLAAWFGMEVLRDVPAVLGAIMVFASGGILYLLFEDVAPQAVLENHRAPPLGAVAGFLLGLAGHLLVG